MNLKKYSKKNKEIINLYSLTDWDYHKGKIKWDDFFDEKGEFFLTIATMEMAKEDGFLPAYIGKNKEPFPKRIFIQEKDKTLTVYEDVKFFTPKIIRGLFDDVGGLLRKKFIFKYKIIPKWWQQRIVKMEKELKKKKLKSFRKF